MRYVSLSMKQQKIPRELQQRIIAFYTFQHERTSGADEAALTATESKGFGGTAALTAERGAEAAWAQVEAADARVAAVEAAKATAELSAAATQAQVHAAGQRAAAAVVAKSTADAAQAQNCWQATLAKVDAAISRSHGANPCPV